MSRFLLVILVACGDHNSHGVDAPVDMPVDAPAPPVGHHHYVVDHVSVPTTNEEARMFALDIDGNGQVDNQLGMVISTFTTMGIDLQGAMTSAVDTGKLILLGDLYATDFTAPLATTFTIYQGADPKPPACTGPQDTTCRHHLTGNATFSIAAGAPIDPPLPGALVNGVLTGGPGHLTIELTFGGAPTTVTLIGARVKLQTPTDTGIAASILAGAISATEVDQKLIPSWRDGVMAMVMRDCSMLSNPPSCGCAEGSDGKTSIGLYDANHDCNVTVDEVRKSSLTMSLFAPDLTIESVPALSLGVRVTAVGAGFVAPQ